MRGFALFVSGFYFISVVSILQQSIKICSYVLTLVLLFTSCQQDMKINRDPNQPIPLAETENLVFVKSLKRWDKVNAMRLYLYRASDIVEISGIPCIGRVTIDSLGSLYGFTLGRDFNLNGSNLPRGSRFEARLGRNDQRVGYMVYLSKPCEIQGYYVRDKAGIEDYKVDFYNDGRLKEFKVYEDVVINGIACEGGKKYGLSLYPDGKLWIGHVKNDTIIKNKKYSRSAKIIIDTSGNVEDYSIQKHLRIMKELNVY